MAPLAQNGSQFGRQADPNQILNACGEVQAGIKELRVLLENIQTKQAGALNDPSGKKVEEVEATATQIMAMYQELIRQAKRIKQMPESGSPRNAPQVGIVTRNLKEFLREYQRIESQYRQRSNEQSARQYRIVRPDASEQEVREAVENPGQVFQQAMMNSSRQGQAQSTLNAVRARHEAIQKIESQMIELAQLFEEMNNLVVQQDEAVANIEMKGEEVVDHMDKGNAEIGTAIVHARNTRKWKWWCLCITSTSASSSTSIFLFANKYLSTHHSYRRRRNRGLVLHRWPRGPQGRKALRDYRHYPLNLSPRHFWCPMVIRLYER
jgi:syntaxin 1B/2/3